MENALKLCSEIYIYVNACTYFHEHIHTWSVHTYHVFTIVQHLISYIYHIH